MLIYKVTNNINNKIYIGKTSHPLESRKSQHIRNSKKPKFHFHNALNKYGVDNFSWEILYECNCEHELNIKEIEFIQEYNSFSIGYNMTRGGEGILGKVPSKQTRALWSSQRKGIIPWNKGKQDLNALKYNKVKKTKKEISESISRASKGRIPWNKGKTTGPNEKIKGRVPYNAYQIVQIDIKGNEIIWNGFTNIEKHFKCCRKTIYKAILNNTKFRDSYWKSKFDITQLIKPVKD
jgi:group I intron endonuclease